MKHVAVVVQYAFTAAVTAEKNLLIKQNVFSSERLTGYVFLGAPGNAADAREVRADG